jgi:hypothetical protein
LNTENEEGQKLMDNILGGVYKLEGVERGDSIQRDIESYEKKIMQNMKKNNTKTKRKRINFNKSLKKIGKLLFFKFRKSKKSKKNKLK